MVKNYLLFCAFLFLQYSGFSQSDKISFLNNSIDFGSIREDAGVQRLNYYFVNKSLDTARIDTVISSCGCSSPHWSNNVILKSDTGVIKIDFNPLNRLGEVNKEIKVIIQRDTFKLTLQGNVLPNVLSDIKLNYKEKIGCLNLVSKSINFGDVFVGEVTSKTISIYNACDFPVFFNDFKTPDFISLVYDTNRVDSNSFFQIKLNYDAEKANDWGYRTDIISIKTNQKIFSDIKLDIHATINESFVGKSLLKYPHIKFDTVELAIPILKQGEYFEHVFGFQNVGTEPLIIRKVQSGCACIVSEVNNSKVMPGEKGQLKVVYDTSGRLGTQKKHIYIISNSPQAPVTELLMTGKVVGN